MQVGGIVLCGGQSSRMGQPKAMLPFGSERMLERVLRLLGQVVQPLVVVAAPQQVLPDLPAAVRIAHDRRENCGPLEGLPPVWKLCRTRRRRPTSPAATCRCWSPISCGKSCGCSRPYDVAVPIEDDRHHPLAAAYRTCVLPAVRQLLEAGRLRPVYLYDLVSTRRIPVEQLRAVDPELRSLMNLNHPHEYLAALAAAGLAAPPELAGLVQEGWPAPTHGNPRQ